MNRTASDVPKIDAAAAEGAPFSVRGVNSALDRRFPGVDSMQAAARRRIPRFAYDYVAGAIGRDVGLARNRDALDAIAFMPKLLADGADDPDIRCRLLGREYSAPFGVAPVGLVGLVWPRAPEIMAAAARRHDIAFALSNFATADLESIREIGGDNAWFQLYPPNQDAIQASLLRRAHAAGYEVLLVTVDVPMSTRREHDIRNGLSVPPKVDLATLASIATRPRWALETLVHGAPRFRTWEPYLPSGASTATGARLLGRLMDGHITRDQLKRIRDGWPGRMLVKGILDPEEARDCIALGADGLVVSNHGARQLDAAPSSVECLPAIRAAVGPEVTLVADSGARSGLDIARMLAMGADHVLLGRAFCFSLGALGERGPAHLVTVLKAELRGALAQMGCPSIDRLPEFLLRGG
ncbi:MAG: alpha-hydroxy-acid oxidizing protein [Ectothiorhodospiraceae bacterium]|nr:alpha-hydroxy-acid oxidizing protein [Ectothiorhodospiraceae bacterium]